MKQLSRDLELMAGGLSPRTELDADRLYTVARRRRSVRRVATAAAASVACAVLAVGAVTAPAVVHQLSVAARSTDAPMPAADAPPEEVVRAYLRAVDARDEQTARALVAPGRWDSLAWQYTDWVAVDDVQVMRVDAPWKPNEDGYLVDTPAGWDMATYRSVRVRFTGTLRRSWLPWDNVNENFGGLTEYGWSVARDPESGRFLVVGSGKG